MTILSFAAALSWGTILFCYAKLLRFAIPLCVQEHLLPPLAEQKIYPQTTDASQLSIAGQAATYSTLAACYLLIPIGGLPAYIGGVATPFIFYAVFTCQAVWLMPQPYRRKNYVFYTTLLVATLHGSFVLFSKKNGLPGSLWQLDVFSMIHPWEVASTSSKAGILLMACALYFQLPQPQAINTKTRLGSIASLLFMHCLFITLFLPFNLYHFLGRVTPWIAFGDFLLFFIKCDTLLLCRAITPNLPQGYIYGLALLGSSLLLVS